MKAQAFLNLVSEMMTAQQDYYKARRAGKLDTYNMLVEARQLEKQVLKVIDEGHLEPDDLLDFPAELRPTEPTQATLFDKESDNENSKDQHQ